MFSLKHFGDFQSFFGWTADITDVLTELERASYAYKHLQEDMNKDSNSEHITNSFNWNYMQN